ncbi:hypothetical protein C4J65_15740 [Streptomyces sp. CB09001]|uniref:hypothetical protein n=1 Tax=unclassified Streptomyces TaxID=2593676 RepID=UPI000E21A615|nr:hypothetical protein [Streptomyces sp. CB09001]AXL89583.1 hypothetical protein C4J65_15740 [Streptomyces sp. CB09001]
MQPAPAARPLPHAAAPPSHAPAAQPPHAPAARPPRAPGARPLLGAALAAVLALTATACAGGGRDADEAAGTVPPAAQSPAALPSPGLPPVLTRGQARAALITAADLGEAWEPTRGAATWRDELLKATAERPDCRRLLDILYTEDLFGADAATAPRATAALDDAADGAQLHYRVTSHRAADLDRTLAWLGTLPDTCGHFTARAARGAARDVRVTGLPLPEAGDARRGLRVTVGGAAPDGGSPGDARDAILTVDLVAVRLGDDAISLTNGTLGEPADDATRTSVEIGTGRLAEARRQGRAEV